MNEVKYKMIASTLEDKVKNNVYNGKLPPVRSLVAEFGVGNPTMNKALKILVKKGLIIPSGPRGNIISKRDVIRAKTNIIAIFCNTKAPDLDNDLMLMELKLRIESDGYKALFMNAPDPNIFDDENFWSSNWVDGYIFAYSSIKKELAYKLHSRGVPFVVANRLPPECGAHWVDFNLGKTLRTFIQSLIEAGKRRIMFAYSEIKLPSYVDYVEQLWSEIIKEYSQKCLAFPLHLSGHDIHENSSKCAEYFTKSQADALIINRLSPLMIESKLASVGYQIDKDYLLSYRSNQVDALDRNFSYAIMPYKTLAVETWNLFKKVTEFPEIQAQHILVDEDIHIKKIT